MDQMQNMQGMRCGCPHHKMIPLFITLIGLVFLLQALNVMNSQAVSVIWPILIILIGLMKMFKGMCKCCNM